MKILVALTQCVEKIGEAGDVRVRRGREFISPVIESRRILSMERAVRPKCGEDRSANASVLDALVMLESVDRIVRGADCYNAELFQNPLNT